MQDGASEIDTLGRPSSVSLPSSLAASPASDPIEPEETKVRVIDDAAEVKHMDEVFEAFIASHDYEPAELGFEDDFITREEVAMSEASQKQSKRVLRELKTVLVGKQREWEVGDQYDLYICVIIIIDVIHNIYILGTISNTMTKTMTPR